MYPCYLRFSFWSTTGSCSPLFVPILQSGMLFHISLGWMLNWISIHSFNIKTWDDSNPHKSSLKDYQFSNLPRLIELSRALPMQWRKCICPAECNHKMSRLRWWVTCLWRGENRFIQTQPRGRWRYGHGAMDMFLPGRPIAKIQIYEMVDCGYVDGDARGVFFWWDLIPTRIQAVPWIARKIDQKPSHLKVRWIGWVKWWISRIASLRVRTFLC